MRNGNETRPEQGACHRALKGVQFSRIGGIGGTWTERCFVFVPTFSFASETCNLSASKWRLCGVLVFICMCVRDQEKVCGADGVAVG